MDSIKQYIQFDSFAEFQEWAENYRNKRLKWFLHRDYYGGAFASVGACVFTHPLDVIKTRLQLQGELRPPGAYAIKYRNVPQSLKTIFMHDGIVGLNKGFVAGSCYQFCMNLIRLFLYEKIYRSGLISDINEETIMWRQGAAAIMSGTVAAVLASPLYLVKIQTQAQASPAIAVGWQHRHTKLRWGLWNVMRGPRGYPNMFTGGSSAVLRVSVASSTQLLCFTTLQRPLYNLGLRDSFANSSVAAVLSSLMVVLISNPLDVICTRMYNQEIDVYYRSIRDCAKKIAQREGWRAFYKGGIANYLRTAPHMVITLYFWGQMKKRGVELQQADQDYFAESSSLDHDKIMSKFSDKDVS